MNMENADAAETPGGGMSKEQRARISQKFRAAKALLSRKRPRHSTTLNTSLHSPRTIGDMKRSETPAQVTGVKIFPLSEISTNTPSPASVKVVKLGEGECNNTSSYRGLWDCKIDSSLSSRTTCVALENEAVLYSFETPNRQLECTSSICSEGISVNRIGSFDDSLSERRTDVVVETWRGINSYINPVRHLQFSASSKSSPASIVLDEDFDEAILEEIDALCEQKAVRKSESEGRSSNFQLEIQSAEGSSLEYKETRSCLMAVSSERRVPRFRRPMRYRPY